MAVITFDPEGHTDVLQQRALKPWCGMGGTDQDAAGLSGHTAGSHAANTPRSFFSMQLSSRSAPNLQPLEIPSNPVIP